jgi:hypothetical protein
VVMAMAVMVARARAVAGARAVMRTRSECSDSGKGGEVMVSGCGLVVARARALAVELRWSGGGFILRQ